MFIKSILDNDFYKFTMMHAVRTVYPNASVTYELINRDPSFTYNNKFLELLKNRVQELKQLKLQENEYLYLKSLQCLPDEFIDYLNAFKLNPEYVHCSLENEMDLKVKIEGPWHETILFEVPLLAIISQTYYEVMNQDWDHNLTHYAKKTYEKGIRLRDAGCLYSDFGTRRRRNYQIQQLALETLLNIPQTTCIGTSNVHFSQIYRTKPIGTMAHEWIMGHAGLFGIDGVNQKAMQIWFDIFKGKYSIGLTDTYTSDLFFKEFSPELAHQYDGIRQDSGDPIEFTYKAIDFYRSLGIDPKTKKIVYSDSLDVDKAIEIQKIASKKVQPVYGIGTHLTNDFRHKKTINIVIKLFSINGKDVLKTSDDIGKISGSLNIKSKTIKTVKSLLKR